MEAANEIPINSMDELRIVLHRKVRKCAYYLGLLALCAVGYSASGQDNSAGDRLFKIGDSLFYTNLPTEDTDNEAIKNYRAAIDSFLNAGDSTLRIAEAYQKIGNILEMRGQYADALDEYHHALTEKQKLRNLPDTLLLTDYLYIGNSHFYLNEYDSCEHFYGKAEDIAESHDYIRESESVFNSIGLLYYALGNYRKALSYYNKTLTILNSNSVYADSKVRLISNIANSKARLGRYLEAIEDYRSILKEDFRETFHQFLGKVYAEVGHYDSAEYFLSRATQSEDLFVQLNAYNNLAEVYSEMSLYDSAAYYFTASVAINKANLNNRNTRLVDSYMGLADIHQVRNSLDSALHYYQLAIINTTFDFSDSTITANPQDIAQAISLLHLFEVLEGKAGAWVQYYQQDQNRDKLEHALETYQLAIQVAQHIQKTYDNDEAKLFLVNKVAPIYEEAIATAVQLYELTKDSQYVARAFQFSENSKASVLAESLRDVKIKALGGVNDSLLQEEYRLKQQITAVRLRLVESQDSAQNETYRQQLNDLEIALARTIKHLQDDEYYYQRKYQPDTLNIAALQRSLLRDDEALLEYFMGQQQVYLFLMTSDDLRVVSVDRTAELDSAWQQTRKNLYAFKPGQGDDEVSLATLYQFLIAPVADGIADVSRLTIVPDGPLYYLPFDLLSVDGRRTHSLLQSHTVHYGYSASLLQQAIDERRGFPTETVLAMAPFAGQTGGNNARSQGFGLLRDSQTEVENVGGSIYTEGKATKRQFLKVAGSYNVLHLATHATVNSEDPSQSFIAFYPKQYDSLSNYRLYTHELYNMRLDSVKLVVLSACEAGNGRLVRGEGVMSLARAFAYAGCPNVVTTLWKADDRSSAYLTSRMHHYLKKGWKKDEALRQAKLDYLNDESVQPSQKAPYYWAHFVFIGDPAPIYNDYRLWWWVGIGVLLLACAGLLLRRKKKRVREMA